MNRSIIFIFLIIALHFNAFNQQRLAILPMAENLVLDLANQSGNLASICIDGALKPPGREAYNQVLEKGAEEILINGQKYKSKINRMALFAPKEWLCHKLRPTMGLILYEDRNSRLCLFLQYRL